MLKISVKENPFLQKLQEFIEGMMDFMKTKLDDAKGKEYVEFDEVSGKGTKLDEVSKSKSAKAKELEGKVDEPTKNKLREEAKKDPELDKKNKDYDSKVAALATAKVITEGADLADTSISVLMAALEFLKRMDGVKGFEPKPKGAGRYKIIMHGCDPIVDNDYTPGEQSSERNNDNVDKNSNLAENISSLNDKINNLLNAVDDRYKALLKRDLEESPELLDYLTQNPEKLESWEILSHSIHSTNVSAINYVEMLRNPSVGRAANTTFLSTWREVFPSLKGGNFNVHHAIEQQVLNKWPGLFDELEINSFENLRGISGELNPDIHLSKIRIEWNKFYDEYPLGTTPTRQEVLNYAKHVDDLLGKYFSPPIRK